MLEQLFSSQTRVKLLTLFLNNPEKSYYVRELTRRLDERINSIRRELANLESVGILKHQTTDRKLYYAIDTSFYCFKELQQLFMKVKVGPQDRMARELRNVPHLDYALMTGFFTNEPHASTDLLLVGMINRAKVQEIVSSFEQELDREINYTIMDSGEFVYRRDMADLFIAKLVKGAHVLIVDKLPKQSADKVMNIKKLTSFQQKI